MKRVLVFGTYDHLHPGHEFFFKQARTYGDALVVVVARDQTVRAVKSRAPVQSENTRLQALEKHVLIDKAVLGSLGDKYAVIEEVSPDVIVLGYDQQAFTSRLEEELEARGLRCEVVRVEKSFFPNKYKSSLLRVQDT